MNEFEKVSLELLKAIIKELQDIRSILEPKDVIVTIAGESILSRENHD